MTNFKTITNDEVFKLINGGSNSYKNQKRGGTLEEHRILAQKLHNLIEEYMPILQNRENLTQRIQHSIRIHNEFRQIFLTFSDQYSNYVSNEQRDINLLLTNFDNFFKYYQRLFDDWSVGLYTQLQVVDKSILNKSLYFYSNIYPLINNFIEILIADKSIEPIQFRTQPPLTYPLMRYLQYFNHSSNLFREDIIHTIMNLMGNQM